MKNALLLFLFALCVSSVCAQDLIITNAGDTLNCKITKKKSGYLYFIYKHQDEIRNTLIPLSEVQVYRYNFFNYKEVNINPTGIGIYETVSVTFVGGYSYHTASIHKDVPKELIDYAKKMKSGYHLGGDITYFFNQSSGFGARYRSFKSSNSLYNVVFSDASGTTIMGEYSDDLKITFIGPRFSMRSFNAANTSALYFDIAIGYLGYSNDLVRVIPSSLTGSTLGVIMDMGYDIRLRNNLMLRFEFAYLMGAISEFEFKQGLESQKIKLEKGSFEGLNRLDFSVGLSLNF